MGGNPAGGSCPAMANRAAPARLGCQSLFLAGVYALQRCRVEIEMAPSLFFGVKRLSSNNVGDLRNCRTCVASRSIGATEHGNQCSASPVSVVWWARGNQRNQRRRGADVWASDCGSPGLARTRNSPWYRHASLRGVGVCCLPSRLCPDFERGAVGGLQVESAARCRARAPQGHGRGGGARQRGLSSDHLRICRHQLSKVGHRSP